MDISKTQFKEYCKCNRIYKLNDIFINKRRTNYDKDEVELLLSKMYDLDGNSRVVNKEDSVMDIYFKDVEMIALKEASRRLNKGFLYNLDTKKQTKVSFTDKDNTLYTYLDGYYEDENDIYIIEVKSTTSHKFLELNGGKLFINNNGVFIDKVCNNYSPDLVKKISNIHGDVGSYLFDIAITRFIVSNCNLNKKVHYYFSCLNSDYVFDGKYVNNLPHYYDGCSDVTCLFDVTNLLSCYDSIIGKLYNNILNNIKSFDIDKVSYNTLCKDCKYNFVCIDNYNDSDFIGCLIDKRNIYNLYNKGFKSILDLDRNSISSDKNIICYDSFNEEYINYDNIKKELENIKYPIYHLDFESFNCPLPRFYKETCFSQSCFQFSCHIEKARGVCDREKDHVSFVSCNYNDRRKEFVLKLIDTIDLTSGGTVLVYNEKFEITRMKELGDIFPEYKEKLDNIINHVYDLFKLIKNGNNINYYNKKMRGSFSIKTVLPCFSDLSYKNIDIHNGLGAIEAYGNFRYMDDLDIKDTTKKLEVYCGLDTYSMFVILNGLINKVLK